MEQRFTLLRFFLSTWPQSVHFEPPEKPIPNVQDRKKALPDKWGQISHHLLLTLRIEESLYNQQAVLQEFSYPAQIRHPPEPQLRDFLYLFQSLQTGDKFHPLEFDIDKSICSKVPAL